MIQKSVFLIDDNPTDLGLLAASFDANRKFVVKGIYSSGYDFLRNVHSLSTDLAIIDISMPILDGFKTVTLLRAQKHSFKILIVSHGFDIHSLQKAKECGADGLCRKDFDRVPQIASDLCEGKATCDKNYYDYWHRLSLDHKLHDKDRDPRLESIVPIEKKLIKNIALGKTSEEIADCLGLSKRTVDQYKYDLIKKLSLKNSCQLVTWAVISGVVTANDFYNL